uniref:PDZ and LIM domain 3 n=1 Tax=Bos indicus x Bos taurus TaxID=30522 RepID=A0A4W2FWA1_BOBOX
MHWRRKWQPTPVFLPGESQGRRSLVGCRLWGRTDRTRLKRCSSSSSYFVSGLFPTGPSGGTGSVCDDCLLRRTKKKHCSGWVPDEFKPIGAAHNRRAQPFVAAANIDDKRQVVSASYNSPIGLYSTSNIQDALHGQLRGLIPSSPQNGCSTLSGVDGGSGRSTPSSVSTLSTICPGDLKVAAKMAPNIPLEMELPGVKIVHAQFNTPMQLYSDDNIMETLQGQVSTALGETPLMSEPTASVPPESDVYRMLHDNRNEPTQPRQSGSFRVLQELVNDGADDRPAGTRSVRAPVTKVHGGAGGTQKMPFCDKCGSGIVGAVVKARDKYRHPECFVCADCNLNLKQKGYFFVEGELYCETHARARMRPPEGYDTVTLYPKA